MGVPHLCTIESGDLMEGWIVLLHVRSLGLEELQHMWGPGHMIRQRNQLPVEKKFHYSGVEPSMRDETKKSTAHMK